MLSLRAALKMINAPLADRLAIRASFGGRTPSSLREAIAGMTDAGIGHWKKIGVALCSENTNVSAKAQGVTTDGTAWYVCSNGSKTVVKYGADAKRLKTYAPNADVAAAIWSNSDGDPHFGAPAFYEGRLYIPLQNPRGIWRVPIDGTIQDWFPHLGFPDNDGFSWCDIHPVTGILYTSAYEAPKTLWAYSRDGLTYLPEHDINLSKTSVYLDCVQGGVFTNRGHLILVRCDYNAIFCFSSLNGHCFGAQNLKDVFDGEAEGVTVRPWEFNGLPAQIHVLELDNDVEDDFYVHSFQVPDPDKL